MFDEPRTPSRMVFVASNTKTFMPTDADTELGTHFTRFTSTEVQILTQQASNMKTCTPTELGTQFTRLTSTKVQILTQIYYSDDNLQQWGQINTNYRIGDGYKGPG